MSLDNGSRKKIGLITAITIVAANMIGVGVYTSLGYQAASMDSEFALLSLWIVGGIVALCGALVYAELAMVFPRSGGEYNFLSKIYHPSIGFLSGWVSITVGFAAPMAVSAMFFGDYFQHILYDAELSGLSYDAQLAYIQSNGLDSRWLAAGVILLVTSINVFSLNVGSSFHTIFTATNIGLILFIFVYGLFSANHEHFHFAINSQGWNEIFSHPFAYSLIYVSFAYSGWNSIAYIAEDIRNPKQNIPRALLFGTALVMVLYVALNFIFLYSTNQADLVENKNFVAFEAATHIFKNQGALIIAAIISLGLAASANSMMIIGPRVTKVVGEDTGLLRWLSLENVKKTPYVAIGVQCAIGLLLVFFATPSQVFSYIGFTLSIFTTLTVIGVFIVRYRKLNLPGSYKTIAYPITPIIFILLELWMMYSVIKDEINAWLYPENPELAKLPYSLIGLIVISFGLILYFVNQLIYSKREKEHL